MSFDRFEDDDDDRPRRREDDDIEDDDRPRRRRRRDAEDYDQPHRGGLILALGIISIVVCQPVGIAAWLMGSNDLKAMDEGRMDPEGRQLTQTGKILGIVGTVLFVLSLLFLILYFVVIFLVIGVAAAGGAAK